MKIDQKMKITKNKITDLKVFYVIKPNSSLI